MTNDEGRRQAGILLPVFSLPAGRGANHGIGDFGPEAYRFADWLKSAGMSYWQILPLGPTDPFYGSSPYRSRSSFALSALYISPELLVKGGLLRRRDIAAAPRFPRCRVDYGRAARWKYKLIDLAWARYLGRPDTTLRRALGRFCRRHAYWLDDYALFSVLKRKFRGLPWTYWPSRLRRRDPAEMREVSDVFSEEVGRVRLEQFLALGQWSALKRYCGRQGVAVIGDLPIYVDNDSADVWANQELFELDRRGRPRFVAGVPPDRFSRTGQLWGNPVYRWQEHRRTGFAWWIARLGHQLALFDVVRIDHFRGLVGYWRVSAGAASAAEGKWAKAPGRAFLNAVRREFPAMPFIAEDLGVITPDVDRLRREFGLSGTRVLQFGLSGDARNPHRPENVGADAVFYTGTHDNNTGRGWFECEASEAEKRALARYVGRRLTGRTVGREMMRVCRESEADRVIIPLQDVLEVGSRGRINTPATTRGNWEWRAGQARLDEASAARVRSDVEQSGRT